jgi:hypothetical protein
MPVAEEARRALGCVRRRRPSSSTAMARLPAPPGLAPLAPDSPLPLAPAAECACRIRRRAAPDHGGPRGGTIRAGSPAPRPRGGRLRAPHAAAPPRASFPGAAAWQTRCRRAPARLLAGVRSNAVAGAGALQPASRRARRLEGPRASSPPHRAGPAAPSRSVCPAAGAVLLSGVPARARTQESRSVCPAAGAALIRGAPRREGARPLNHPHRPARSAAAGASAGLISRGSSGSAKSPAFLRGVTAVRCSATSILHPPASSLVSCSSPSAPLRIDRVARPAHRRPSWPGIARTRGPGNNP